MAKLEKRRLVTDASNRPNDTEDSRRRYYTLTPLGRRVLEAETARLSGLMKHVKKLGVVGH
jgi:DNA-binding PadR family transcriptional regulator